MWKQTTSYEENPVYIVYIVYTIYSLHRPYHFKFNNNIDYLKIFFIIFLFEVCLKLVLKEGFHDS